LGAEAPPTILQLEHDGKSLPRETLSVLTHDDYWESIAYFLEKIIPAAKENDVKMCHVILTIPPDSRLVTRSRPMGFPLRFFEAIKALRIDCHHSLQTVFQLILESTGGGVKIPANGMGGGAADCPVPPRPTANIHQIHMRNIPGGPSSQLLLSLPGRRRDVFLENPPILAGRPVLMLVVGCNAAVLRTIRELSQAFAFGYGYIKV